MQLNLQVHSLAHTNPRQFNVSAFPPVDGLEVMEMAGGAGQPVAVPFSMVHFAVDPASRLVDESFVYGTPLDEGSEMELAVEVQQVLPLGRVDEIAALPPNSSLLAGLLQSQAAWDRIDAAVSSSPSGGSFPLQVSTTLGGTTTEEAVRETVRSGAYPIVIRIAGVSLTAHSGRDLLVAVGNCSCVVLPSNSTSEVVVVVTTATCLRQQLASTGSLQSKLPIRVLAI